MLSDHPIFWNEQAAPRMSLASAYAHTGKDLRDRTMAQSHIHVLDYPVLASGRED